MYFCKKLRGYFFNRKEKDVRDNKQFWRTVKPLLSGKIKSSEKILSDEGDKIISGDKKLNHFEQIFLQCS